ncbi:MAG: hypothetical protein JW936_05100 [Sedimentisphaerales bacterium]|nr:hypothetical protein [Sedimentisphaerales bacterium]
MKEFLFDSGWLGLALGLVLLGAALIGWSIKRYEFNKLWFLPGLAVIVLLVGLDWLVETDREQLRHATERVVDAAEEEDAEGVLRELSDKLLLDNGLGYAEAAEVIRRYLSKPLIANNVINGLEIVEVTETSGVVELTISTVIDPESEYGLVRLLRTQWRFTFGMEVDGRFRILNMAMMNLNGEEPIDVFTYRSR